jgi:hypothetical protein
MAPFTVCAWVMHVGVVLTQSLLAEGEWQAQEGVKMRHGQGTLTQGKNQYQGAWLQDQMHGEGVWCRCVQKNTHF